MTKQTGKMLFGDKNVLFNDGVARKLEFTFSSLYELEAIKNDDFQAVFDMFEKDFNSKNMLLGLWACLLPHNPEFEGLTEDLIYQEMKKLINAENYLVIRIACIELFGKYWNETKNSKQIPEEYRKLMEEMEQSQGKKKK